MAWLHEDCGYTFNGSSPITGLTPREELTLNLGFLIKQEQMEEQQKEASGENVRKSSPKYKSQQEALNAYEQKHNLSERAYQ